MKQLIKQLLTIQASTGHKTVAIAHQNAPGSTTELSGHLRDGQLRGSYGIP